MDLGTTTAWIDRLARFEARLSDTLGRWLDDEADPEVALHFATQANHHGWHADLWAQRRPSAEHLAPTDTAVVDEFFDSAATAGASLERMVGVTRVVLPRLVSALERFLDGLDERLDAPTVRVLRLVLADEAEARREGERLVQRLVTGSDDDARAAVQQARLEHLLVGSGALG